MAADGRAPAAAAPPPAVKRGFLTKLGRVMKTWKSRYFVLKDGMLMYFEQEEDVVPKGSMSLYGAAVVYVDPVKVGRANCIEITTPSRSLFVSAESREELQEWALAVQHASIVASGGQVDLNRLAIQHAPPPAITASASASTTSFSSAASAAAASAATAASAAPLAAGSPAPAPTAAEPAAAAAQRDSALATSKAREEKEVVAAAAAPAAHPHADKDEGAEAKAVLVTFSEAEQRANLALLASEFAANAAAFEEEKKERRRKYKEKVPWEADKVKLRKSLKGHEGHVNCVALGSGVVVSGGDDATVRVWNLQTLKEDTVLEGHKDKVRAVLAVGDRVVSGGESGAIKVWSIRADKCLKTLRTSTGKTVEALAITSNGRILLAASQSTVQLWDLNDFRCVGLLTGKHSDTVTSMAVAGSYLFTGSADKTIKVWNMTNLEVVASVEGFETWVFSLAVSTEHLYAGSGSLRAFELSALFKGKTKPTAVVERPHDAPSVQTLSVTQDDRFLVSASIDGMLKVWKLELKSKAQPEAAVENRSKFIFSAVVHERRVFTADREGVVKVWE